MKISDPRKENHIWIQPKNSDLDPTLDSNTDTDSSKNRDPNSAS